MDYSTVVGQLKDLFPDISKEFLTGLCDAYRDEGLNVTELIEVVLSFENPPLEENPILIEEQEKQGETNNGTPQSPEATLPKPAPLETVADTLSGGVVREEELLCRSAADVTEAKDTGLLMTQETEIGNSDSSAESFVRYQCEENEKNLLASISPAVSEKNADTRDSDDDDFGIASLFVEDFDEAESLVVICKDERLEGSSNQEDHMSHPKVNETEGEFYDEMTMVKDNKCQDKLLGQSAKSLNPASIETADAVIKCQGTDWGKSVKFRKSKVSLRKLSSGSDDLYFSPRRAKFRSCKVKSYGREKKLKPKLVRRSRLSFNGEANTENSPTGLQSSSHFEEVDSKFSLLIKVLPDADPVYLQSKSQEISDQEELLLFISQSLEKRDYPRVENNQAESKLMAKFDCTIEEFLQEIPDPQAEFNSNYYIRTGYEQNAEIYLQSRYQNVSPEVIKVLLEIHSYNLTRVCHQLETEGQQPNPYCLANKALHHEPSVFFHQEVWYIEHRAEIQNMLDSVVQAAQIEEELNRPPTPPPVEEVFECGICRDDVTEYTQLGTCDGPGGHLFCKTCVRRNTEVKIGEGATTFPCLANCGGFIPLQTIEEVLPHQMFEKLMEKIQVAEVRAANIPGLESCPFCPYAYFPELGADLFICSNPPCMKLSCRTCRKEDHGEIICEMFREEDEETARHFIENRMTEALVRECYSCGKEFVKQEGCNKMTCTCGAKMCYLCRQPVTDYSHFNGPGGDNYNRCELFSDENTVHGRPVAVSAQQALNELVANNPGLQLNAEKLIPK